MTLGRRSESPAQVLEPGDRFEVHPDESGDRLTLPGALGPGGFAVEQVEDPDGTTQGLSPEGRRLVVPGLGRRLTGPDATTWLEYQAPGRFRLVVEPGTAAAEGGSLTS